MPVLSGFPLASLFLQPEVSLPQFQLSSRSQAAAQFQLGLGPTGAITHNLAVRSQAQSGKLSARPPRFCLLWMLAKDAVISTKPTSDPPPSSSFHKVFLKPPPASICIYQLLGGKVSCPVSSSVLFSESFIHAVLSLWSSPDGTMVYISIVCACAPSSSV